MDAGDDAFFKNLALLRERVGRVTDLALELNRRRPSDVLMVYFQDTDIILHRAFRWCDRLRPIRLNPQSTKGGRRHHGSKLR